MEIRQGGFPSGLISVEGPGKAGSLPQVRPFCAMLRPVYVPLRGENTRDTLRIARNIMQRGPTCEEDPALPGLFTLIGQLQKLPQAIFGVKNLTTPAARQ